MSKMDADRGYAMRVIDGSGVQVYMYLDEPGIFRNAFGQEVDESLARLAGFDVDRLLKERAKRERLKAAFEQIEAEMAEGEAKQEVALERSGYTLIDLGLGRFQIKDPEGGLLTAMPVPEEVARRLFDQLVPEVKAEEPKKDEEPKSETKSGKKVKENGSSSSS